MGERPDSAPDPEGLNALDDMLSGGQSEEVELREWYAARGMQPPPDRSPAGAGWAGDPRARGQVPPSNPTVPYSPLNQQTQYPGQGYRQGPPQPSYDYAPPPPPPPQHSGPSGSVLAAAAVVGVLVVLAAVFLLWLSNGRSAPEQAGTTPATSSATSPKDSGTSADSPTDSKDVTPPDNAKTCTTEGALTVAVGNKVTSCPFATNVGKAYLKSNATDGEKVTLKVRSPVTKRKYTMTCQGNPVVICQGGTNALVYLY